MLQRPLSGFTDESWQHQKGLHIVAPTWTARHRFISSYKLLRGEYFSRFAIIDAFERDLSKDSVRGALMIWIWGCSTIQLNRCVPPGSSSFRKAYERARAMNYWHRSASKSTQYRAVQRLESWETVTKITIYFNKTFVAIEELHPEIHAAPSRLLASGISL